MELKFDQGRGYNFEAKALGLMSNLFMSEIISLSETTLVLRKAWFGLCKL